MQVPISPLITPELVVNVSNAGGINTVAAARMTSEHEGNLIRSLTDKSFGVNIFILSVHFELSTRTIDLVRIHLKQLLINKRLSN